MLKNATGLADSTSTKVRHRDYTVGSLTSNIRALALPMTLEQLIMGSYLLFDGIWVGRLGPPELAALGMSGTLNFVLTSVAMGLGVGATATVARRVGERELEQASHTAWQVLVFGAVLSAIIGITGLAFAHPLLRLLGADIQVASLGSGYLRVVFAGLFATMLTQACNAILRGAGEASRALKAIAIGYGVSLLLDPVLILGWGPIPRLGLPGAALAVILGGLCSLTYGLAVLSSGSLRVRLDRRNFHLDLPLIWRIVRIGLPSSLQMFFRSASRLTVLSIIALFGTNALAGYSAATRVLMFGLIPCFGLGNAASTLVGQNLGASKPERSVRSAWIISAYSMAYMALMAALFVGLPEVILRTFSSEPEVVSVGALALRLISSTQIASALGVVMGRSLDGAGDTTPAMIVNLGTLWLLQIPLAYVLARFSPLGVTGVWIGFATANLANGLAMAFWFHRGSWKRRVV